MPEIVQYHMILNANDTSCIVTANSASEDIEVENSINKLNKSIGNHSFKLNIEFRYIRHRFTWLKKIFSWELVRFYYIFYVIVKSVGVKASLSAYNACA